MLSTLEGFSPRTEAAHEEFGGRVAALLRRMLHGEAALSVLASLAPSRPLYISEAPKLRRAVAQEVDACDAIDVHAHCFAHEYGPELMLYGVDLLLTAGFGDEQHLACSPDLVAQYLSVADDTPDAFARLPSATQAERIREALFVRRSPISEACTGVVATLAALGLTKPLGARSLGGVRAWYAAQGGARFNDKVMRLAKLKYVVTSHSPFFSARQLAASLHPPPPPPRYRAALEVNSLLEPLGWPKVLATLAAAGEPASFGGLTSLLERCVAALHSQYLSCSTPHTFAYDGGGADGRRAPESAAVDDIEAVKSLISRTPLDAVAPGAATLLDQILLLLCRRHGIPLLLRMGTRRGMNASLRLAGDGVGLACLDALGRLCAAHPTTKCEAAPPPCPLTRTPAMLPRVAEPRPLCCHRPLCCYRPPAVAATSPGGAAAADGHAPGSKPNQSKPPIGTPLDSRTRSFLVTVLNHSEQHEVAVLASRFPNVHLWGSWWYEHLTFASGRAVSFTRAHTPRAHTPAY